MQQNFWEQGNLMKVNFREHLNLFLGNKGKTQIFSREQGNMYPPWEALCFGSFSVVLMSYKVNFHVVRSALQNSVCLLSVYFCWSGLLQILRFAAYSFAVLCSLNLNLHVAVPSPPFHFLSGVEYSYTWAPQGAFTLCLALTKNTKLTFWGGYLIKIAHNLPQGVC